MIRLPPTRIDLTDSDIDFHLQGILLRRGLIADFENLNIESDDDMDEDDDEYTQFPRMNRKSDTSSSPAESTSDIPPDTDSSGGSYSSQGYQAASYGRGVVSKATAGGISQLDGASLLDYTALHVKGVLQDFPARFFDGNGRLSPGNNRTLTALLAHCLHIEHTPGLAKHNNNKARQKTHLSETFQQILSTFPALAQCFASIPDLSSSSHLIASSIGSTHHLAVMARDKRPPRVPRVSRLPSHLCPSGDTAFENGNIVSARKPAAAFGPPMSGASVVKTGPPGKVKGKGQGAVDMATATHGLPSPADPDFVLNQGLALEDPFHVPVAGKKLGGHSTSASNPIAVDAENISSSAASSQPQLTAGYHHMMLPEYLHASPHFETAYNRTRLAANSKPSGSQNVLDFPSVEDSSHQPLFEPVSKTNVRSAKPALTASSGAKKQWPTDAGDYTAPSQASSPCASTLPPKKGRVLSIHDLLNPKDETENTKQSPASNAFNRPNQPENNHLVNKSKTTSHYIYGSSQVGMSENEDKEQRAAAEVSRYHSPSLKLLF
ncbi:hypothetical protein Plec18170_003142 [Paecilomyces lecythidis]